MRSAAVSPAGVGHRTPRGEAAGAFGGHAAPSIPFRLAVLAAIAALHLAVYFAVNHISAQPPLGRYWDFGTAADAWVPYIPLTSVIYYLGDVYIAFWGGAVLWQLGRSFNRAAVAYVLMILVAGSIQALLPGQAPWPDEPFVLHRVMHSAMHLQSYAVFPSMHVALSVLPAGVALSTLRSVPVRAASTAGAVLISISTVTAREHSVLDVVAGALLGLACWWFWRAGVRAGPRRPNESGGLQ